MKMSVLHITKNNFQSEVLESDRPVLIDFWASWCGPCRMVAPIIEEIAAENDRFKVGKIDVDAEPELAAQFRIMSIPTLIVMPVSYTHLDVYKRQLRCAGRPVRSDYGGYHPAVL